jgi:excisionase family DNA binding protein
MIEMIKERYLNTREVAELLGTGQEYVRQLLREGKIKGVKVGKKWKIKESEIKDIVEGVKNWVDWHTEEAE